MTISITIHFPKKNIFAAARIRFIFVTRCAGNKASFSFRRRFVNQRYRLLNYNNTMNFDPCLNSDAKICFKNVERSPQKRVKMYQPVATKRTPTKIYLCFNEEQNDMRP